MNYDEFVLLDIDEKAKHLLIEFLGVRESLSSVDIAFIVISRMKDLGFKPARDLDVGIVTKLDRAGAYNAIC